MAKRGQGEGSISKLPNGKWWARITVGKNENGTQKRQAFYGKTRKEVQEQMTAALNDINKGVYVEPSQILLQDWLDTWLEEYKKPSVKLGTYQHYWSDIHNRIKPILGYYKLKDLRHDMVQRFINQLSANGLSYRTVDVVVSVLKQALDQAIKNDMLTKNVAADVIMPTKEKVEREVMTPEEQDRFVKIAASEPYGEIIIFMLSTGLRIGEATALTWQDIDLEAGTVDVNKSLVYVRRCGRADGHHHYKVDTPKTPASYRSIPLLTSIQEMLRKLKERHGIIGYGTEPTDNVFRTLYGGRCDPGNVRKRFHDIMKKAGISRELTPHSLRHTFATRGLENGVELRVMQELLGHGTLSVTADLYTHVLPEVKRDSMMKLEGTIQL